MSNIYEQIESYRDFKLVKTKRGEVKVKAYGRIFPLATPLSIELTAYRFNLNGNALQHMIRAHHILWPQYIETWNNWTERRFSAHTEGHKVMTWAGGANCGKSFDAAQIALLFWLANPTGRTVLVASTTLTDLDSRIWGYLKRFYTQLKDPDIELPGRLYTSKPPCILWDENKQDTVHGMFAVALQRGSPTKTASTLIGRHPDEAMLVIVDEGTDVTPGFMDAVPNWEKAPFFQMIVIGNSSSMFDPHGILSQPSLGWSTIDPDFDSEWPTKEGICLYFDCFQSPAITDPDPRKRSKLGKFLFTEESIEKARQEYGDDSPQFWRFTRGFWPPEDAARTVLTPVIIDKFKAQEPAHWAGLDRMHVLAGLDPAFTEGGDHCILRFALLGKDVNGVWVLDFQGEEGIHILKIDAKSKDPSEYQILEQTVALCQQMGVQGYNLAVDTHGIGNGLGAIFKRRWDNQIYEVSSQGQASDTWVNEERTIRANEAYDRRVTELWFSMRKFVQAGQIKGLDDATCQQLCTRLYDWKGKKYSIETKEDYKLRLGKIDRRYTSPDHADAACLILDLARQAHGFLPDSSLDGIDGPPSLLRKYFSNMYRDGLSPEQPQSSPSGHPSTWEDGFTVSQFDVEESDY